MGTAPAHDVVFLDTATKASRIAAHMASILTEIVDGIARRLQVQERITTQICETLASVLKPRGVAVAVDATHLCMVMRGVQKQLSETTTTCMLGEFEREASLRQEFLLALSRNGDR